MSGGLLSVAFGVSVLSLCAPAALGSIAAGLSPSTAALVSVALLVIYATGFARRVARLRTCPRHSPTP